MKLRKTRPPAGFPVLGSPVFSALILLALFFSACPTTGKAAGAAAESPALPPSAETAKAEAEEPEAGKPEAGEPEPAESPDASLVEALYRSYENLSGSITGPLSVAVINVASADPMEGEFAAEELTLLLVNSKKYRIVERRSIDIIRAEQNFQLSGEVDDDTAVSIGRLTGAALVITGAISTYEALNYLRLRALDVETGEIRAMSSRPYR
jgi:PBP1b-binding outer membrane lipoprotein LpoB